MSLSKKPMNFMLQLGVVALAMTVASCSSNEPSGSPATSSAVRSSEPAGSSASLEPTAAARAYSQEPQLVLVNEAVPLAPGHPDEYTVQLGDTLWDIASTFLKDPWYWPEVWFINPQVENPHLIYPGDVLALVTIEGRQRITNVRASTYRMSPQARVTPLDDAIANMTVIDAIFASAASDGWYAV